MICPNCRTTVPDDSLYCFSCGAAIGKTTSNGTPPAVLAADTRQIESLLAAANLMRMRGQWKDAEARCVEVIRVNPNNQHAHSLLGDIYRDQGQFEDARQWYHMALDLDPKSDADRVKLAEVERERSRQALAATKPSARVSSLSPGSSSLSLGTQNLLGRSPVFWLRALTVLSVVFMVTVVALLVMLRNRPRVVPITPSGTVAGNLSTTETTVTVPRNAGVGYPGPQSAFPVPSPSAAGPSPGATSAVRPPSLTPSSPTTRPGSTSSTQENALQDYLQRTTGLFNSSLSLGAVTIDPRQQRVTLLLLRAPSGATRENLIREAMQAASAVFSLGDWYQRVTTYIRLNSGGGRAEPAFVGDLERTGWQSLSPNATTDEMERLFTNVWWAYSYMPPPPPENNVPNGQGME
jgi:hypothetical protein